MPIVLSIYFVVKFCVSPPRSLIFNVGKENRWSNCLQALGKKTSGAKN